MDFEFLMLLKEEEYFPSRAAERGIQMLFEECGGDIPLFVSGTKWWTSSVTWNSCSGNCRKIQHLRWNNTTAGTKLSCYWGSRLENMTIIESDFQWYYDSDSGSDEYYEDEEEYYDDEEDFQDEIEVPYRPPSRGSTYSGGRRESYSSSRRRPQSRDSVNSLGSALSAQSMPIREKPPLRRSHSSTSIGSRGSIKYRIAHLLSIEFHLEALRLLLVLHLIQQ